MQCDRVQELLGAYGDGELSGDERRSMSTHLESCKACGDILADYGRIGRALKRQGRIAAPPVLAARIGAALDRIEAEPPIAVLQPARRFALAGRVFDMRGFARRAASLAAACFIGALAAWNFVDAAGQSDRMERDVLNAHMRSLLQESPVQVASNDKHNVQPWFAGRTDFAPAVKDLAEDGFPLVGGRLDYVADRRVGVVVYKRGLHMINVFMWPSPSSADSAPRIVTRKGYNLLSWSRSGVSYWAASDLNSEEMRTLSRLL